MTTHDLTQSSRQLLRPRRERPLHALDDAVRGDLRGLPLAARGHLDDTAREALAANDDAHRETDEVDVLELHAGALVTVVVEDLDARGLQFLVELVRRREDRRVPLERRDDARIRRERHRPDDSDVVVMLLDRRRDRAAEAKPVASHRERDHFLILVRDLAFHRLGIFRPELEDVPHLDAPFDVERARTHWRRVALTRGRDLDDAGERGLRYHVAGDAHAGVMKPLTIGPAPEVCAMLE